MLFFVIKDVIMDKDGEGCRCQLLNPRCRV